MQKVQSTLNFQGKIVKSQHAVIQYDPFKKQDMYFLPKTGKSYVVNAKNKRKLYLSGNLELKNELFINNRFVKDNAQNRAKLNQEGKIKNPSTNRWLKDTALNRRKIEQAKQDKIQENKNKVLDEIRALRQNKASTIITNAIKRSLQPRLETTTYQTYFKYTVPTVVLNRVPALDIGSLSYRPDIGTMQDF